jgi:polyisoprenoid-binding protein YceI
MKTLLALTIAFSSFAALAQATYKIDPSQTKAEWVGYKIASEHRGFVPVKEGSLQVKDGVITGGTVTMNMDQLTVTDIQGEMAGKLVGHLKHEDFFATDKHPEAKLAIKSSKKTAKGLEIVGDLTIRGVTHPITFTATDVKETDKNFTAKSIIKVDRTLYNVQYGSGKGLADLGKSLGDKLIKDVFDINVTLSANK